MSQTVGFAAKIAPELQPLARPIGEAIPHPDNPRKHRIDKIAKSLAKHGQRSPIIVQRSTNYIVKGNGTHEAARMLGWTEIAMVVQDLTDEQSYPYLLDDNRASDLSTYDNEKLHAALEKMVDGPGLGETLWEIEEFEDLDERINGQVTLAPAPTGAAHINDETVDAAARERRAQTEKMREVPLMMTAADYPVFAEWVRTLQKAWGATGTQVTIYEAVHRQYLAETGDGATTGKNASQKQLDHAVKLALGDIRQILFQKYGSAEALPRAAVFDLIASMMPKSDPVAVEQVPGQTEAFPEEAVSVPSGDSSPDPESAAGNSEDPETGQTVDAAAAPETISPQEPQGEDLSSAVADSAEPATDATPEPTDDGAGSVAPEAGVTLATEEELAAEFDALHEAMARRGRPEAFQQQVIAEFEHGGAE